MSKPGLLIVDDQEEIRSQLRWALDDTYDVHPVGNAREALAYMKRERPPLVTLDLGLPPRPDDAVEGLALLEGLLAIDRLTKVVVLTGNNERSSALRAIQSGAFDYIQKPVHLETLRVTLSRARLMSISSNRKIVDCSNKRRRTVPRYYRHQFPDATSFRNRTARSVLGFSRAYRRRKRHGKGAGGAGGAIGKARGGTGRSSPSTAAPFRKIF